MSQNKIDYDEPNPNTEFFNGRGWWVFYGLILIGARTSIMSLLSVFLPALSPYSTSVTNIAHTAITIYSMHWVKGAPFWMPTDQGRFSHLTFWEQIDYGYQHTSTKKILTAIPVVLCIFGCSEAHWAMKWMVINVVACLVSVLGKLPVMHKYRILGINKD